MNQTPTPLKDKKNIIIALLLMLCIIQAAALMKNKYERSTALGGANATINVTEVSLDSQGYNHLLIAFDKPVGPGSLITPVSVPATISPDIKGQWIWINPYGLKFTAEPSFPPDTQFEITMKPETFLGKEQRLGGKKSFKIRTGHFSILKSELRTEPVPGSAKKVRITGYIKFSNYVSPEETLKNISITAPDGASVPISITTSYKDSYQEFSSSPVEKTEKHTIYTLSVSPEMQNGKKTISLGKKYTDSIDIFFDPILKYSGSKLESKVGESNISLSFSSQVSALEGLRSVSVSPETDFSTYNKGNQLVLNGKFLPGKKYTITLAKGLMAQDGAALPESKILKLTMPNIQPEADFTAKGMFLSNSGYKTLGLKTVNTSKINLSVDRVFPNNLFTLFTHYGYLAFNNENYGSGISRALGSSIYNGQLKISGKPNTEVTTPLSMQDFISRGGNGLYRVSATIPGQYGGVQRWVMLTDLGIVGKESNDEFLFWISSLSKLTPRKNIQVKIISNQNQVLGTGKTDSRGMLVIKKSALKNELGKPFMAVATGKKDMTFLLFDKFSTDMAGLDISGKRLSSRGYTAFAYGERNIYRPGETLSGAIIIRSDQLTAPKPMPLVLVFNGPQGLELNRQTIRTDKQGMVGFSRKIPDYAPTGSYAVRILAGGETIGRYDYRVEEFVPDRISAELLTPESIKSGENLNFEVEGKYLFGPAASGLPVKVRATLRAVKYAPEGFSDYRFDTDADNFKTQEIFVAAEDLNDSGKKSFTFTLPDKIKTTSTLEASLSARVSETGGRGVTAVKNIPVKVPGYHPGIKKQQRQGYQPGSQIQIEYITLNSDSRKEKAGELVLKLYRDRWQTVVRSTPSGSYRYETRRDPELIETRKLTPSSATGSFTVTPREYGSYRVILTDSRSGLSAQGDFFCGGWGYSPWALKNPSRLEIIPEKKGDYTPGKSATFQIRSPFPGKMLVTVEGRYINWSRTYDLKGNTATVKVPVKNDYSPNVYVTATVIRKASSLKTGSSARAVGAAPLFVKRESNRLNISLDAPDHYRPEKVLTIKARTAPGARLTIAAVDEGILRLTNEKTADPFGYFYARRALGVKWFDTFTLLMPDAGPVDAAETGGGARLAAMAKFAGTTSIRRVKPVTFWSGILTADSNGKVEYKVKLPRFNGALRIMAVAADGKKFGSGSRLMTVSSPLVLTPTLPRFLATAEKFSIPVSLRNDTPQNGTFKLEINTAGPLKVANATIEMDIPKSRQKTVFLDAETLDKPGNAKFTVQASGNNETVSEDVEVNSRPAFPVKRTISSGFIDKKESVFPADSKDIIPSTLKRTITIGTRPMTRLSGRLESLLAYPYGCAEQTVSRAFPLLRFSDLARELAPGRFKDSSPEYMVQQALTRLSMMQSPQGGFSMWPGGRSPDKWVSVYAAHFLYEAGQAGFQVDSLLLNRAMGYLSGIAKNVDTKKSSDLRLPCYALYVLSLAGNPDRGSMNFLREQRIGYLDDLSLALLGGAFAATGDMNTFRELSSHKGVKDKEAESEFGSEIRNLAIRLGIYLRADHENQAIPQMAQNLGNMMADGPCSTQDNAFGFMALGSYYAQLKNDREISGIVTVDGVQKAVFSSNSTAAVSVTGTGQIKVILDSTPENGKVVWSIYREAVPLSSAWKSFSNGISIKREFLTRDGEPLELSEVRQGQLIAMRTEVKTTANTIKNVVVQSLLPTGLEVENSKLASREDLKWVENSKVKADYVDLRDDRVLVFTSLPKGKTDTQVVLLRAVTAGKFVIPPVQAESMYDSRKNAGTDPGTITIVR
ncbi:alpha-2-macroglobulin family protein [Maridesulfovibrio bastinii]|uniref:alpha-2-macroglobulin family protein n=1 Tax=Maridesulfovibrio bastinii TaxID=47157 RepID=UPI000401EF5D|nr:MG2 domain-containing protein [Maridesulfovibrio bastinii]